MEPRTLEFAATACAGQLQGGGQQTLVHRVCTDSRQVQAGDLFFALRGKRFDGHEFLAEAAGRGAVAVVTDSNRSPAATLNCAVIAVSNTREALGRLAAEYRKGFGLQTIAVGGSNGKTTTKDLIASVLQQKLATLSCEASFNNDIGVPLSLLRLEATHQAGVFEVGTNHPGELAPLVKMVRPSFGVLTHIGREHLEFFGSVENVAKEQGWLAESLPLEGKLFVNGDSRWTESLVARTHAKAIQIGFLRANDWRAHSLRADKQGLTFRVHAPETEFAGEYRLNLLGRHQAVNALFAVALGAELGLSRNEIQLGLATCNAAKMRLQLWEFNGVRVLDDAYNANADSMAAALQTLLDLPCKGRRVAVLGDMAELGAYTEAAHEEAGRRAAQLGVGQLFAVGKMAAAVGRAARAGGLNRVFEFGDVETAAAAVRSFVRPGDLLLLKASRSSRLERIGEWLRRGAGSAWQGRAQMAEVLHY